MSHGAPTVAARTRVSINTTKRDERDLSQAGELLQVRIAERLSLSIDVRAAGVISWCFWKEGFKQTVYPFTELYNCPTHSRGCPGESTVSTLARPCQRPVTFITDISLAL